MNQPEQTSRTEPQAAQTQRRARAVLYTVLTALAVWVLHDFLPAMVWASVIAIALWPVLERLDRLRSFKARRSLEAALLTLGVALLFVLPLGLAAARGAHEAHGMFDWFQAAQDNGVPQPEFLAHLPFAGQAVMSWWQDNLAGPLRGSPVAHVLHSASFMAYTRHFGMVAAHGIVLFGFMLMTLFFILRAGLPLGVQLQGGARRAFGADGALLITRMATSVRSTVTGLVTVGMGEGALLGVAYAVSGVPHAVLLGLVTAVAAMLPFCAPIVFCAAALWLLAQGATVAAIGLAVFGFVVVLVAEHAVRPVLIGGSTRLPFLLALFGILGGAETLGLLGLFIGPSIMTVLMVLWSDWAERPSAAQAQPDAPRDADLPPH